MSEVQTPGDLIGGVSIKIHTKQAWRLVYSRRSDGSPSPMIGLFRFAKRMGLVWDWSAKDDPFADHVLALTHQSILNGRKELEDRHKLLKAEISRARSKGVAFDVAESSSPVEIPLNFGNPYGYLAAHFIVECDEFIRSAYTCRHAGLLSYARNEENIRWAMRAVLRSLDYSRRFIVTGVSRADYKAQNAKWREAASKYHELPSPDILNGDSRPKICPPVLDGNRIDDVEEAQEFDERQEAA